MSYIREQGDKRNESGETAGRLYFIFFRYTTKKSITYCRLFLLARTNSILQNPKQNPPQ